MVKRVKQSANLLDRAISYFSPEIGMRRLKARAASASVGFGGFTGGQYSDRLAYWQPGGLDADGNLVRDLRELRNRSHDLVRNSPIASGAIDTIVTNVVGTGLSMNSCIDADFLGIDEEKADAWQSNTEREYRMWSESVFCDALAQQNFAELQDLALRTVMEGGDAFILLADRERENWPYSLALQVIEPERITNPNFEADVATRVQGIEKAETGEPVAIHVADRHPQQWGVIPTGIKWQRVPIRGSSGRVNVIHLYRKKRPGQTRGIPELSVVMEPLKQLGRYTDAEIAAAVVSGAFSVFVKMNPDAFSDLFDDNSKGAILDTAKRWDGTLQPGAAINLLPGEEIETADASRPNPNFDPFVGAVMKQIGIGLGVPYEVITKHFQSSYSAARAALLDAWRTFRIRRAWLASKLCQVVYEEWLADAVATGRISAPGFFNDAAVRKAWCGATWTGDGPGAIDPLKEAQAARERMDIGLSTLTEEISAYDGGSWDSKHKQQVLERKEREEGGLVAPVTQPMPGAAAPVGGEKPAPADDENADALTGLRRAQAMRKGRI